METVLVILLFIVRALIIWQMSTLLHNISDKKLKGVALSGMAIYVGYILWSVTISMTSNPLVIIGLGGIFLSLLAVNKEFKRLRGDC